MTGEIDTQGRILKIGGLGLKLETAYDAGCKTVIIPKENLQGEDSIGRLPDAFRKELQVLSYEEWKGDHEPFDYMLHTLQVVAVDHIVQAVDVAFIDQEEFAKTEEPFIDHAHQATETQRRTHGDTTANCCVLYARSEEDLDFEGLGGEFWQRMKCVFLIRPEIKNALSRKNAKLENYVQFKEFDQSKETFPLVLSQIQEDLRNSLETHPIHLTIIAPFFFLQTCGICSPEASPVPFFDAPTLLANNYTVQELKIKRCRPLLNRTFLHFARLPSDQLAACPFLSRRNGVYCVNLSFIAEKYRLDLKRAEEIVNQGLKQWLKIVEEVI
jgi:ATP-dependent Lon protease